MYRINDKYYNDLMDFEGRKVWFDTTNLSEVLPPEWFTAERRPKTPHAVSTLNTKDGTIRVPRVGDDLIVFYVDDDGNCEAVVSFAEVVSDKDEDRFSDIFDAVFDSKQNDYGTTFCIAFELTTGERATHLDMG